jgi:hypothetical protein
VDVLLMVVVVLMLLLRSGGATAGPKVWLLTKLFRTIQG